MAFPLLINSQGEQVTICNSYKSYFSPFRKFPKVNEVPHANLNFTEFSCSAPFTLWEFAKRTYTVQYCISNRAVPKGDGYLFDFDPFFSNGMKGLSAMETFLVKTSFLLLHINLGYCCYINVNVCFTAVPYFSAHFKWPSVTHFPPYLQLLVFHS